MRHPSKAPAPSPPSLPLVTAFPSPPFSLYMDSLALMSLPRHAAIFCIFLRQRPCFSFKRPSNTIFCVQPSLISLPRFFLCTNFSLKPSLQQFLCFSFKHPSNPHSPFRSSSCSLYLLLDVLLSSLCFPIFPFSHLPSLLAHVFSSVPPFPSRSSFL